MPSPPWTTPDQDEFLESKLSDFLAAQRNKTTSQFWKTIHHDFFERWTDPQDEIPAIIVPKKRKGKARVLPDTATHVEWVQMRKKQITNWYNNRRNGVTNRRQNVMPIVIGGSQPSQRILSEINLYSKKYYDSRVREKAAEAWSLAMQDPAKPSRISVINKCLAQCWNDESEEIKKEIREEYETLKSLKSQRPETPNPDTKTPRTAESYAAAQASMPHTILSFISQLAEQTGFCCTVITGGPDPSRPGRMRVLGFHEGVDRFGQRFGSAYGSFTPNVMEPYQKFLYNVYSDEELANRVLSMHQNQTMKKEIVVTPPNEAEPPLKRQKIAENESNPPQAAVPVHQPSASSTLSPSMPAEANDANVQPPPATSADNSACLVERQLTPAMLMISTGNATSSADVQAASARIPTSSADIQAPSAGIPASLVTEAGSTPEAKSTPVPVSASVGIPVVEVQPKASIPPAIPTTSTVDLHSASIFDFGAESTPAPVATSVGISTSPVVEVQPKASIPPAIPTTSTVDLHSASIFDFDAALLARVPFSFEEFDSVLESMKDMHDVNDWEVPQARALYTQDPNVEFYNTTQTGFDTGLFTPITPAPSYTTHISESIGSAENPSIQPSQPSSLTQVACGMPAATPVLPHQLVPVEVLKNDSAGPAREVIAPPNPSAPPHTSTVLQSTCDSTAASQHGLANSPGPLQDINLNMPPSLVQSTEIGRIADDSRPLRCQTDILF